MTLFSEDLNNFVNDFSGEDIVFIGFNLKVPSLVVSHSNIGIFNYENINFFV
jgi:hypothetical protein